MPEVLQLNNLKYKCAEIHCCVKQNFSICCNYCELTTNDFKQFCKHFLELHFGSIEQNELIEILEEDFTVDEKNRGQISEVIEEHYEKTSVIENDESKTVIQDNFNVGWNENQERIENSKDFVTKIEVEFVLPIIEETKNEITDMELSNGDEDAAHEEDKNDQTIPKFNGKLKTKSKPKIKVRDFQSLFASDELKGENEKNNARSKNTIIEADNVDAPSTFSEDSLPIGRFMCKHCYKSFSNKINRNLHQLRHTEVPKFQCAVCRKDFYTQFELRNHMRYHKNELAYVCEKCGKAFRHSWVLKKHSRTHSTKSRTLPCPVCGKLFAYNDNLHNHMQTHNTVAKFACQECPKTFTQSKLLWAHKKRYHSKLEGRESRVREKKQSKIVN